MRGLILSHLYADPERRGKLQALAGLGVALTAAIPGEAGASQGQFRLAPIPVSGNRAEPGTLRWSTGALRRLFTDVRPDLIQIEEEPGSPAAAAASQLAARFGIPLVLFSWESHGLPVTLLARRRLQRVLQRARGLIGGNGIATGLLAAANPLAAATTLPQEGLDLPTAPPPSSLPDTSPHPGLRIGFVGRLVPERGPDVLLRTLTQVHGRWGLTVIGTGPLQEDLERFSQRFGLASRIVWQGGLGREATDALWPTLDCLVVPSQAAPGWIEPFSPMLVRAMAHGVAPIVTAVGALPEIVGTAGMVVQNDDDMVSVLQDLVAHPDRCHAVGEDARRRVLAEYAHTVIAERTLAFWRRVLGDRSPAAA